MPWYARAGKGLAQAATEAVIELQAPPRLLFDEAGGPSPERNLIRLRLGKSDGVTFPLQAKTPGPHLDSQSMNVSVDFAAALGDRREAYERLLGDALVGSPAASPARRRRADVADRRTSPRDRRTAARCTPTPVGSWGPQEADRILPDGDTGSRRQEPARVPKRPLGRVPGGRGVPQSRVWALGRSPVRSSERRPTEDPRPDDLQRARPSVVIVNTGDGKGKSSAAFGVMIRAVARGWPVAVVQFVKSGKWHVGEEDIGRQLGVDWFNVGDGFTWDSADLDHDKALARQGWDRRRADRRR